MIEKPVLETVNLQKFFRTKAGMLHAVDGITLSVNAGETLGIVGESGCGKSTLGRTVLKLEEPTAGRILFDGEDISGYSESKMRNIRTKMQMIFQDPYASLNPRMTVEELIAQPIRINKTIHGKAAIHEKVRALMETVELSERFASAYPHELDGGRRQRIGIARALSVDPRFIVCDEPVSALDVSVQAQILNLLMDLQESRNLSYLFITHNLSVVKHISKHIAVLYMGKCVEYADTKTLFERPVHPYTRALLKAIPKVDLSMKNKKREILTGEVTSPINPGPGCRFAPRCPYVTDRCRSNDQEFREIEEGHFIACDVC